jgi:galactonate dehydratase
MKILKVEDLHADGGWRNLSFLKVTTDSGLVGWSEFSESRAAPGLTAVIRKMAEMVIGQDPRAIGRLNASLRAATIATTGGIASQAIAAIENACLDIKGKALGVPVYDLFGGAIRDRLPLYWSHCGTFRVNDRKAFETHAGTPPLLTLDDVVCLGEEVVRGGYRALKTNILVFDGTVPWNYRAGNGRGPGSPEANFSNHLAGAIKDLLSAFQQGVAGKAELMLDLNFNFKPEGLKRIAKLVEPYNLLWLEADLHDAQALASIRQSTTTTIASLENVYGLRAMLPFLEQGAVDIAIVDVQWNGFTEAMKLASLADSYGINVAAHNYHGHLSTLIGAHFAATIPNFRIMEFDVDEMPWAKDLVTHPLEIENGELQVPNRPGWGTDVNEEMLKAHPPRHS